MQSRQAQGRRSLAQCGWDAVFSRNLCFVCASSALSLRSARWFIARLIC